MTDAASGILDDVDSRPGSVTSLARTVLGAYLRGEAGWTSIADFSLLLGALDISPSSTRIAVSRLKKKGVLHASTRQGKNGYSLTVAAETLFARGDDRIFGFRQMSAEDPWLLVSVSLPESERAVRQQLRRRLTFMGCGSVSPGLYICPHFLAEDVATIVAALEVEKHVITFSAHEIHVQYALSEVARRWWALDSLAERHRDFIRRHSATLDTAEVLARSVSDREAFARFVPVLDEWRVIPYIDPGLPAEILPADWPGARSVALFSQVCELYLEPSRVWVRSQL